MVPQDFVIVRVLAGLTFMSECWVSIQLLSNWPVWSLAAEFWYYVLFAIATFMPASRKKIVLMIAACLLVGPRILVLLPVWALGVIGLRYKGDQSWSTTMRVSLLFASLVCFVLIHASYPAAQKATGLLLADHTMSFLSQAKTFWLDWVLGAFVALHIVALRGIVPPVQSGMLSACVRRMASSSFALYLFHDPILHFTRAFLPADESWIGVGATLLFTAAVGPRVESSKGWWHRQIGSRLTVFSMRMTQAHLAR